MLAGNVDFIARYADHSEHRSSIHNGAAARLEHGRDLVLHAQPHALRVDVHDAIESLLVLLEERSRHLLDPGVVEGEVEPAELLQRPFDEFLDLNRLRDVGRHEESFAPLSPEEPHGFFPFGRSSAGHNDSGSFARIGDGGGSADSRGPTRHNRHFVLKLVHDRSPFLRRTSYRCDSTCGQAFIPPSTVRFAPVMYEDSGPATNATIAAISSTCPYRLSAVAAFCGTDQSPAAGFKSVSIGPGCTLLTVMPRLPTSLDNPCVNIFTAPLVAEYGVSPGIFLRPPRPTRS